MTILVSHLVITDPDDTYPGGFTLTVLDGTNYTRSGNTITPAANFSGNLTVPVYVNDGNANSNTYNLTVAVTAVSDIPTAYSQTVTTNEDTSKAITLTGSDPEGSPLTYSIVSGPAHGALSGTGSAITYTPAADYNGPDSFTFKVSDGAFDSVPATVSITVSPVNDIPLANTQTVTTNEDTGKDITLTGSDVDGDTLTYTILTQPAHGTLSGTAPNVTYTPAVDYNGPDSFTFKVNDGALDSAPAGVNITVNSVLEPTSVTLSATSPTISRSGQKFLVSFTVTTSSSLGLPTGNVDVKEGDTILCSAVIDQATGVGSCEVSLAVAGEHNLTLLYGGDSEFAGGSYAYTHMVEEYIIYLPIVVR